MGRPEDDLRIDDGALRRGTPVEMVIDGVPVKAFEGETVSAALLAECRRALRTTARDKESRGMYCGIGICFDCVMTIDGRPNVRACQTPVRARMQIESQRGAGSWRWEP